jgi:TolB protein
VSPDGQWVVFSSQVEASREGEIYLMRIDGTDLTRLTNTVALNYAPSWSPDGSKIVFVSDRDGNENIFTMNPDGSDQQRLTDDPGEDTTPAWGFVPAR